MMNVAAPQPLPPAKTSNNDGPPEHGANTIEIGGENFSPPATNRPHALNAAARPFVPSSLSFGTTSANHPFPAYDAPPQASALPCEAAHYAYPQYCFSAPTVEQRIAGIFQTLEDVARIAESICTWVQALSRAYVQPELFALAHDVKRAAGSAKKEARAITNETKCYATMQPGGEAHAITDGLIVLEERARTVWNICNDGLMTLGNVQYLGTLKQQSAAIEYYLAQRQLAANVFQPSEAPRLATLPQVSPASNAPSGKPQINAQALLLVQENQSVVDAVVVAPAPPLSSAVAKINTSDARAALTLSASATESTPSSSKDLARPQEAPKDDGWKVVKNGRALPCKSSVQEEAAPVSLVRSSSPIPVISVTPVDIPSVTDLSTAHLPASSSTPDAQTTAPVLSRKALREARAAADDAEIAAAWAERQATEKKIKALQEECCSHIEDTHRRHLEIIAADACALVTLLPQLTEIRNRYDEAIRKLEAILPIENLLQTKKSQKKSERLRSVQPPLSFEALMQTKAQEIFQIMLEPNGAAMLLEKLQQFAEEFKDWAKQYVQSIVDRAPRDVRIKARDRARAANDLFHSLSTMN